MEAVVIANAVLFVFFETILSIHCVASSHISRGISGSVLKELLKA
jgi:hypothetical protein